MCDRLNKGGKLDLSMSSQTGEPPVQQQQQKAVNPLEPLSEIQEEEDETGKLSILVSGLFLLTSLITVKGRGDEKYEIHWPTYSLDKPLRSKSLSVTVRI